MQVGVVVDLEIALAPDDEVGAGGGRVALAAELDPQRVFRNAYLDRVLGA